ncbi:MAG: hypothetical protein KF825_06450 [Ferruginibacter sp.]|nr:hypothetical protein [Ferruginibacter sp.]
MKYQKILIVLLFSITSFTVAAQKEQVRGVYISSDDFTREIISFDNNCNRRKIKIKLNDFFLRPYISINLKDSSVRLYKKDIFGYINCRNQVFRFNGKQELLLLNAGEQILIYKHIISKPPTGRTNVTNYYFSLGVSSPIVKLTIKNLKNAFPADISFHNLIDQYFKYNTDLAEFDEATKMYKINWLFGKTP